MRHDARGCFKGILQGFISSCYHSLSANVGTIPVDLTIAAATEDSEMIIRVQHYKDTLKAIQYHPERILSEAGDILFRNFLALKCGVWEEKPECGVLVESLTPFPLELIKARHLLRGTKSN